MTQHNPYDFITSAPTKPKRSLIPGGNSKTGRLIVAGLGGVVLLTVALIVISLLNSGSAALKADYTKLTQQQTELVRVSQLGTTKARQADTKNFAITTQLSVASQQSQLLAAAGDAGAPTDPKDLARGKDTATDEALTAAEQSNQFDEKFTEILQTSLQNYQKQLKKIYDATSNEDTKAVLSKSYNAVDDLLSNITTEP